MRVEADIKLGFKDVLFKPKRSTLNSRSQVNLERPFRFLHAKSEWTGIPIIAANMDTVGTFAMALALAKHKMMTAIHKHYSIMEWRAFFDQAPEGIEDFIMVSCGTTSEDFNKLTNILAINEKLRFICIDVANGYSEHFVKYVGEMRNAYPEKIIMAGNVVTGEIVEELILKGADIIKVGIGPGSVCTTRVKTGVGYPQLSAVIECSDAAHGVGGHVVSDGGCTCAGDVSKAFGGGADFVMIGGMFSGHDESGGEAVEENGKKFRIFYGMSSKTAMDKHTGGLANYRASEGKTVKVPYHGPVIKSIQDILGGVRSTCTYVGAEKLQELTKRTTFIRTKEQENKIFDLMS